MDAQEAVQGCFRPGFSPTQQACDSHRWWNAQLLFGSHAWALGALILYCLIRYGASPGNLGWACLLWNKEYFEHLQSLGTGFRTQWQCCACAGSLLCRFVPTVAKGRGERCTWSLHRPELHVGQCCCTAVNIHYCLHAALKATEVLT